MMRVVSEKVPAVVAQPRTPVRPPPLLLPEQLTRAPELPPLPGQASPDPTLVALAGDYAMDLPTDSEKPSLLVAIQQLPELPPLPGGASR